MPKVSVVIPCYNLGHYLDEAVASALAQTMTDLEIIVVDDGSTDPATCALLADYRRPRTRVLRGGNAGVSTARNRGIDAACGEYILPLDADDRIAPGYLEKAVAVLEQRPEVGIVYCRAQLFGEVRGEWVTPEFSLPHMLLDNLIFSAALFRRNDWLTVGGYDARMRKGWEDWDFWLRVLELRRKVFRLDDILFSYRIRKGSRERSLGWFEKLWLMQNLIVRHFRLYAANAHLLLRILLTGSRRCPAVIKV